MIEIHFIIRIVCYPNMIKNLLKNKTIKTRLEIEV
jgi:hypothetical protein